MGMKLQKATQEPFIRILINYFKQRPWRAYTMTKRQNAKLNMALSVLLILGNNMLVWQALAAFVTVFNSFKTLMADLQKAIDYERLVITGWALNKRKQRIDMAEKANVIRSAIQAYALDTGDNVLYKAVSYSLGILITGSYNSSRSKCQIIHNQAADIIADLADYGVLPGDLVDLQKLVDDYAGYLGQVKDHIAARSATRKKIADYFKVMTVILKKMDLLMANFRTSAPDFYAQYFKDRKIYDAKTQFTEVRATILNAVTGEPINDVLMKLTGQENTYEEVSNTSGVADAKQIHPELYNITFELPGFKPETLSKKMSPGEKELVTVKLVPIG